MPAAYDTYDYPTYWQGREYEHTSETAALKSFLGRIPQAKKIVEIGAGYGRLLQTYIYRGKKVILSDPSAKLLSIAREEFRDCQTNKIEFVQSSVERLNKKIKSGTCDLVIMVRVIHHIEEVDNCFKTINKLLKKRGYFILEFANKSHAKATFKEFLKGNLTFPLEIFPKDIRCAKNVRKNTLPFINYHPDDIYKRLKETGFEILEKRSVSNFRNSFLKRFLPIDFLITIDRVIQVPLALINFGPSIFILAKKRDIPRA